MAFPLICFDNAATSWPEPPEVIQAVVRSMEEVGNFERLARHLSLEASRIVCDAHEALARLLHIPCPLRIALGHNAIKPLLGLPGAQSEAGWR